MRPRIAYLCLQATTQGQASHAHVHEIIAGLRESGYDVDLYEPAYAGVAEAPGVTGRVAEFLRVQLRLAVALSRYDAVYVRAHPFAWPTARGARRRGIPLVQECNGPYADLYLAWPAARPLRPLIDWMARSQYTDADALLAVTDGLAEWLAVETGRSDVTVIGNGANTDVFRPDLPRPDGLPERYAVFFGALAPWQGIGTMLRAASRPEWPAGVSLVFVGDGAMRPEVAAAADASPDRVVYLGRRSYEESAAVAANSCASLVVKDDAVLARTGFSPLKLYESMAAGVPVVVSDVPGLADTVEAAGCGVVIPAGDPAALAAAVADIAAAPGEAYLMGARGREAAVREHSWRSRAQATAEVIAQALAARIAYAGVPPTPVGDASPVLGGRPLKVAMVITDLDVGGAETTLYELLRHRPPWMDVRVYSLIDGGELVERIRDLGVTVTGLGMRRATPDLGGLFALTRELRAFRPDLAHTWLYHADLVGGLAARFARTPCVVWHLHNSDLSPGRVRLTTRMVARTCAALSRTVPDVVLSCSEQAMRAHQALGYVARKFVLVPNGVDTRRFAPDRRARASVREEFGLGRTDRVIGLVARRDPQKDHATFFAAAKGFFEQGGDASFLLAGRGITEWDAELARWRDDTRHPERVVLAGPRDDVPRLMASLDVATSTSVGEAFPVVLTEAMSCGVPCVVTDVGDSRLIVGDTGVVVPVSDADALAGAWLDLLALPKAEWRGIGDRARERVVCLFRVEEMAARVWNVYVRLMDGSGG